jgi:DNA-binding transcriptional LysR family regulator
MRPDLNLLVVLDALCRHGSVSRAAERLSLSQPAVSHALGRLRAATGDPLFTRSGRGLVPTPRALALAAPVAGLVAAGQACLAPEAFDPARDAPRFRLGISDFAGLTLVPRIAARVMQAAPLARIEALPVGPDSLRQLEDGRLELSFWGTEAPGGAILYQPLFQEHFVMVLRRDHPVLGRGPKAVSVQDYVGLPHAIVSLGGPAQSPVDLALAKDGGARRIALTSPSFAANLAAVEAGGLVATVPSRLAGLLPASLVALPLPFAVPSFRYGMIWHLRGETAPALRWLRQVIVELFAEGTAPSSAPGGSG